MQKDIFLSTYEDFDTLVVIEIIDIYLDEYKAKLEELLEMIKSGDFDSMKKTAHSIKGSNSVFYDPLSTQLASELEHSQSHDISALIALHHSLTKSMEDLAEELKKLKQSIL